MSCDIAVNGALLMDGCGTGSIKIFASVTRLDPIAWDACARGNPFVCHGFLAALEESRSVAAETGWLPQHIGILAADGRLLACAPVYLKSHSFGEYVFDWGWANAYERAGGRYYPKLQACVPFTPVTGPRLLLRPDAPAGTRDILATALVGLAGRLNVSSLHITFNSEDEQKHLDAFGFLGRDGLQFHWHNQGYVSFEDFLDQLSSRKRKSIRKERAAVAASGIRLRTLRGPEIKEHHWDAFYRFYLDTADRKGGHAYLSRPFFSRLSETLAERVILVIAEAAGHGVVGAALHLAGDDALYGRYWGCEQEFRFLHFEACYYQAIEIAIAQRLQRVEAGAQGEHKLQRGYLPIRTYSSHWIADPRLRRAVQDFLVHERRAVAASMHSLSAQSPYREQNQTGPTPRSACMPSSSSPRD